MVGPTTEQEIVELIRDARCVKVRPAAPRLNYPDLPRPAEEILNEGRSSHYDEAVTWLAKARDAHLTAGREKEWRAYLEELIAHHRRKYNLRPMLEDLA